MGFKMTVSRYFVAVLVVVFLGLTYANPIDGNRVLKQLESFRKAQQGHFIKVPSSQQNGEFNPSVVVREGPGVAWARFHKACTIRKHKLCTERPYSSVETG